MADKPRYQPPSPPRGLQHLIETQQEAQAEEDRQMSAAIEWLQEKWGERPCPYCDHVDWHVGTPLDLQVYPDQMMSPSFPVMCGNCGQTALVNALVAGVLVPPPES